ncbi:MAG: hypothetical protein ACD_71C00124G0015, partial [uncultured bacterium (gcode 4)]
PGGIFVINSTNTGTIDFRPNTGFTGSASTIYTIQDGSNNTATGLLTVAIECIQDTCEQHLVAYAPYNVAGDLKMYTGSTSHLSYQSGGTITSSGANGMTGIVIPNWWGSFLKYTLPTGFLGNSFSIEMSVRGGALKRLLTTAHLFALGYNEDYTNQLSFWIHNNNLVAIKGTTIIPTIISQSSLPINDLNRFYTLRFNFINNGAGIQILLDGTSLNTIDISSWSYPYTTINNLKIGTSLNKINAWNGTIDFVKIYK